MNAKELKIKSLVELKELAKEAGINPMQKQPKLITQLIKHFKLVEKEETNEEVIEEVIEDFKGLKPGEFGVELNKLRRESLAKLSVVEFNNYVYAAYNSKLTIPIYPSYEKYLASDIKGKDGLSVWLRMNYIK